MAAKKDESTGPCPPLDDSEKHPDFVSIEEDQADYDADETEEDSAA
jgi:hypothetical protein